MADDFVEVGEIDLSRLDAHGLLALSRHLGIVPVPVENKTLSEEVLRHTLVEHMKSA